MQTCFDFKISKSRPSVYLLISFVDICVCSRDVKYMYRFFFVDCWRMKTKEIRDSDSRSESLISYLFCYMYSNSHICELPVSKYLTG